MENKKKAAAGKICVQCGRKLITVSNKRGVQYWEKKLKEPGGQKFRGGFSQVGEKLIRVSHRSSPRAEVWSKVFPLRQRYYQRTLCPKCLGEPLVSLRRRKEGSKLKNF